MGSRRISKNEINIISMDPHALRAQQKSASTHKRFPWGKFYLFWARNLGVGHIYYPLAPKISKFRGGIHIFDNFLPQAIGQICRRLFGRTARCMIAE